MGGDAASSSSPTRQGGFHHDHTPARAMFASSRLVKLSVMNPTVVSPSGRSPQPFHPYESMKPHAHATVEGQVAGARPSAMGMFKEAQKVEADLKKGAPLPRSSILARSALRTAGLRSSIKYSSSKLHSVGTSISALAAEPPSGNMFAIQDAAAVGDTMRPRLSNATTMDQFTGKLHHGPLQNHNESLKESAMRQYQTEEFAVYRDLKPLHMRLPSQRRMLGALKSLNLSGNAGIGARAFRALLQRLERGSQRGPKGRMVMPLTELHFSNCGLTDAVAKDLYDFLLDNATVEALDLSDNSFKAPFVGSLIKALPENNTLRRLDLSGNGFGDELCCRVLRALKDFWLAGGPKEMRLTYLGLRGTRMGRRSVFALAYFIRCIVTTVKESWIRKGEVVVPATLPADYQIVLDISGQSLDGVATVILARQLEALESLPLRASRKVKPPKPAPNSDDEGDGVETENPAAEDEIDEEEEELRRLPLVRLIATNITLTCKARQSSIPGELVEGEEELRALKPELFVKPKGKKGKGGKKGKKKGKGPKVVPVVIGEPFVIEAADPEQHEMLELLTEHELEATEGGVGPGKDTFHTPSGWVRTRFTGSWGSTSPRAPGSPRWISAVSSGTSVCPNEGLFS